MPALPYVVGLVVLAATSDRPTAAAIPHPLVVAGQILYERKPTSWCDEVVQLAKTAPGLQNVERAQLHLLAALRAIDDGHEAQAKHEIARALRLDPSVPVSPGALLRLHELIAEVRSQPPEESVQDENGGEAATSERVLKVVIKVMDLLLEDLKDQDAKLLLESTRTRMTLNADERAQVELRWGILKMDQGDIPGAKVAFREALRTNRSMELPRYATSATHNAFNEVKYILQDPVVVTPPPVTVNTIIDIILAEGPQRQGLYVGGVGLALIAGGAVAGPIAATAYRDMQVAAANGDWGTYIRNRDTGKVAAGVADGLLGVGALAVGVGVFIVLRSNPGIAIGASSGPGHSSVVVGGNF